MQLDHAACISIDMEIWLDELDLNRRARCGDDDRCELDDGQLWVSDLRSRSE